jgi:hypothetical protein
MSLESDLYAVLGAVCPRVFPDFAPFSTTRPFITWQQIGGQVINPIANEVADKRNAMVQINVWADTRIAATEMSQQIEAALVQATQFQARPIGALLASGDEDLDIRGTSQDFTIWASR